MMLNSVRRPARSRESLHRRHAALLNQLGHERRPPRLVRRAEPRAVVAVEVFVERNEVAPVRIVLKALRRRRTPRAARRAERRVRISRRDSSTDTSHSVSICPEPDRILDGEASDRSTSRTSAAPR